MASTEPLKFAPFSSAVDVSFFQELSNRKLNSWGLSIEERELSGTFQCVRRIGDTPRFVIGKESFQSRESMNDTKLVSDCVCPGILLNVNTVEEFKNHDKVAMLKSVGDKIVQDMNSGAIFSDPELLNRFMVVSFADLKTHQFIYWFCFPALVLPSPALVLKRDSYSTVYNSNEREQIRLGINSLRLSMAKNSDKNGCPPFFIIISSSNGLNVLPLSDWNNLNEIEKKNTVFAFIDPCGLEKHPGWPLRNYLYFIHSSLKQNNSSSSSSSIKVLCYRSFFRRFNIAETSLKSSSKNEEVSEKVVEDDQASFLLEVQIGEKNNTSIDSSTSNQLVGWELNARGKAGPKSMNLKSLMDPLKLAETSADLNLSLMRWRAIPTLQTEMLSRTKVLLLGAGTLGCNVARCLLGWGIRHINFVDNGSVSYSNPTRQSLFEFQDCENGGKPKAEAAANALKRIYPKVISSGYKLTIPMPGHNIETELDATRATIEKIKELILEHDVIYLLTDTRESRWLPTMLCAAYDKMMIDVALGMDSYLVMRHGAGPAASDSEETILVSSSSSLSANSTLEKLTTSSPRLGCYFCNDVVAPQNSTKDRTLDQQCTVTRPGLAPIASALGVELMVALLHHPKRHHAPADVDIPVMQSNVRDLNEKPLGCLPHQLRGFLSNFGMLHPLAHAFEYCTACNPNICNEYHQHGFDFIRNVCNNTNYLSEISGLEAFQKSCEELVMDTDFGIEGEDGDDF